MITNLNKKLKSYFVSTALVYVNRSHRVSEVFATEASILLTHDVYFDRNAEKT